VSAGGQREGGIHGIGHTRAYVANQDGQHTQDEYGYGNHQVAQGVTELIYRRPRFGSRSVHSAGRKPGGFYGYD
jgi:hypothetical protein